MASYKVGDKLAFRIGFYQKWHVEEITHITPTGRMQCGHYTVNPDLTIRGKRDRGYYGPYRAEKVTQEILDSVRVEYLSHKLSDLKFNNFSVDVLEKAAKLFGVE